MWRANLTGADLTGADLTRANLTDAKFSRHPRDLGAYWDKDNEPKGLDTIEIDQT
jgi:hypothetical protein